MPNGAKNRSHQYTRHLLPAALVLSEQITASDFEPDPAAPDHGWWLGAGKGKVIDVMLGYLGDRSLIDGKNTRRSVQIDLAARKLIAIMMREE